ncbi:MAG: hypothetical protein ACKOT0_07630 [bacterium]
MGRASRAADSSATRAATSPSAGARAGSPVSRRGLGLFAAAVLVIVTVGGVGGLVINTSLNQGAFTLSELQAERVLLAEREEALAEDIAMASSPLRLEEEARKLGMVPQEAPAFIRLEDGAVLGNAVPQPAPIVEEPVAPPDGVFVNGYLVDPETGEIVMDPQTGLPITEDGQPIGFDGAAVDGVAGEDPVLDPVTGEYVDPATGEPVGTGGLGGDDADATEESAPEPGAPAVPDAAAGDEPVAGTVP